MHEEQRLLWGGSAEDSQKEFDSSEEEEVLPFISK